jgi:hypothetical protein
VVTVLVEIAPLTDERKNCLWKLPSFLLAHWNPSPFPLIRPSWASAGQRSSTQRILTGCYSNIDLLVAAASHRYAEARSPILLTLPRCVGEIFVSVGNRFRQHSCVDELTQDQSGLGAPPPHRYPLFIGKSPSCGFSSDAGIVRTTWPEIDQPYFKSSAIVEWPDAAAISIAV